MTTTYDATLYINGDTLTVHWTGSVWQAPCNGSQHSRVEDAMRVELKQYLADCDADATDDAIEEHLENIERQD